MDGTRTFEADQVPRYYSRKTTEILHKYGPGPEVHFHLGTFDTPLSTWVPQEEIKDRLVASQRAVLHRAAALWGFEEAPPGRLLDIGCGLGGGSLLWAGEYGAEVTALTVTGEHVPIIARFAGEAGLSGRVTPLHGDVHTLAVRRAYTSAVAIESSGYMDRERLFAVLAGALVPGARVGIQEHFVRRPELAGFLDGYYKTRLGTVPEYVSAAGAAGFALESDVDVTDEVAEFWIQSMAWTAAERDRVARGLPSPIGGGRLAESELIHARLFRAWRDHAVETRLLLFRLA
ncbi:methyltransferase domain-containing protein [Actinocorallia lasiicapitis]